jgi:transcriptional regulator with XRE-family HTH domain
VSSDSTNRTETSDREVPHVAYVQHLGTGIRKLRKARGLSQDALAEELGVSRSTVLRIERGKETNPHLSVLLGMMRVLEVESFELLCLGLEKFPTQRLASRWQPETSEAEGTA